MFTWGTVIWFIIQVGVWLLKKWKPDLLDLSERDAEQLGVIFEWIDAMKAKVGTKVRYGNRSLEQLVAGRK